MVEAGQGTVSHSLWRKELGRLGRLGRTANQFYLPARSLYLAGSVEMGGLGFHARQDRSEGYLLRSEIVIVTLELPWEFPHGSDSETVWRYND